MEKYRLCRALDVSTKLFNCITDNDSFVLHSLLGLTMIVMFSSLSSQPSICGTKGWCTFRLVTFIHIVNMQRIFIQCFYIIIYFVLVCVYHHM